MLTSRAAGWAFGFLGLLVMAGCQADADDPEYLGADLKPAPPSSLPAPTGTVQVSSCPVATPLGGQLAPTLCPATTTVADGVTSGLTASDEGLLVSVGTGVESHERLTSGCPGPGTQLDGLEVASGTTLPGPLAQGDDLWVAESERVSVHDATGALLASCALAGARALAASGGVAWAAVGASVVPLAHDGATCAVSPAWAFDGALVTALGARVSEGVWVAVEHVGCGTPVTLERRDAQGRLVNAQGAPVNDQGKQLAPDGSVADGQGATPSPRLEAAALGLCTVSAVAEEGGSLWLGDRVCGRLAQVDTTTGAVLGHWEAPSGQVVLAVAARAGQTVVLTGTASGGQRHFWLLKTAEN